MGVLMQPTIASSGHEAEAAADPYLDSGKAPRAIEEAFSLLFQSRSIDALYLASCPPNTLQPARGWLGPSVLVLGLARDWRGERASCFGVLVRFASHLCS